MNLKGEPARVGRYCGSNTYSITPEVVAFYADALDEPRVLRGDQTMSTTTFPILIEQGDFWLGCPTSVPWSVVEPHRAQARRNHCGLTRRSTRLVGAMEKPQFPASTLVTPW